MEKCKDLAIIVVFYNPTPSQVQYYSTLANIYNIIVVDNSKSPIEDYLTKNLFYIPLNGNYGIAYAQNKGIDKASELGFTYLIFFDQDSSPDEQVIFSLYNTFKKEEISARIGALGPTTVDNYNEEKKSFVVESSLSHLEKVNYLISTGTTTSMRVISEVGRMEDNLFIDCVDFEWCWRAKDKGYEIYLCNEIIMPHKVGKNTVRFMGHSIIISSPFRYYYKTRNTLILARRNYVPAMWKIKAITRLVFTLLYVPFSGCFHKNKISTLKNMIRGAKDFFNYKEK